MQGGPALSPCSYSALSSLWRSRAAVLVRLVAATGLKESEERQGALWWGAVHERGKRRPPC